MEFQIIKITNNLEQSYKKILKYYQNSFGK